MYRFCFVYRSVQGCAKVLMHCDFMFFENIQFRVIGSVVGFKANCLLVGPGPTGEVLSVCVWVFLRDPSAYLR